ncbi:MAG: hypothetical protein H0U87_01760 [Acidobacteria bacterium]|jgi:hypothetical protein|nr:hypothetical protein [Acidobacteriota bacterium]
MKSETEIEADAGENKFVEGIDYYFENGLMVLTERFLLKRGYCCRSGCRNCPFTIEKEKNLQ